MKNRLVWSLSISLLPLVSSAFLRQTNGEIQESNRPRSIGLDIHRDHLDSTHTSSHQRKTSMLQPDSPEDDPLEDEGIPIVMFQTNLDLDEPTRGFTKDIKKYCSICGPGFVLTNPNKQGTDPNNPSITCAQLQQLAKQGKFTERQCQSLVDLSFLECGCEAEGQDIQSLETVTCSVCGEGYIMSNPSAKGIDPYDESISCQQVQKAAESNEFTADQCRDLMNDLKISKICGCEPDPFFQSDSMTSVGTSTKDNDSCSICGKGFIVSIADAVGIDPLDPDKTCGELQEAAENGMFTEDECQVLVDNSHLSETCGCEPDPAFKQNSIASVSTSACSICGKGLIVSIPDAAGIDPLDPDKTCGELQEAAENGKFTEDECQVLIDNSHLSETCGCKKDPALTQHSSSGDSRSPPPNDACSICGEGFVVSLPDADGIDPDAVWINCGQLQEAAENGKFTAKECQEVMDNDDLFETCGCEEDPLRYQASSSQFIHSRPGACSICGDGYVVSNPDANGIDPNDESITCGQVQKAAEKGKFTAKECQELMDNDDIFETCGCEADPALQYQAASSSEEDDAGDTSHGVSCSICGNGFVVTKADANGIDPNDASITCGHVQRAAENGKFTAEECKVFMDNDDVFDTCGCEEDPALQYQASSSDRDSSPPGTCSICGNGYMVTKPDANGIDPNDDSVTCGEVQKAAKKGKFTADECQELMDDDDIFDTCGCEEDPALHYQASSFDRGPSRPGACSVCGDGFVVTKPDANGIDPYDDTVTCGQVQKAAEDGKFTAEECQVLMDDDDIFDTCGCEEDPALQYPEYWSLPASAPAMYGGPSVPSSSEDLSSTGCEVSIAVKCVPPRNSPFDSCDDYLVTTNDPDCLATPKDLTWKFIGGRCNQDNVPDQDYLCEDFPSGASTVGSNESNYVEVLPHRNEHGFYFQGTVKIGDALMVSHVNGTGLPLDEEIVILVYDDEKKGALVQMMILQTNCTGDLNIGSMYGAFELVAISNTEATLSMTKNIFLEVTLSNIGSQELHVEHVVTIVDETSRDIVANKEDIVLSSGDEGSLTLVEEFNIDASLPRVVSSSATVMVYDKKKNSCTAFQQLQISVSRHGN